MKEEIVNPQTLEFAPAIKDAEQAGEVYKRLLYDNKDRNAKAADIMRRFNDAPPFNTQKLRADNQSWRRNASTGFFSSLSKRAMAPLHKVLNEARYFTYSKLEGDAAESTRKTEIFRQAITRFIRTWAGFGSMKSKLITEDVIFGYTCLIYTDPYEYWPTVGRQDMALFPEGTDQETDNLTLMAYRQNLKIHELAKVLQKPEESELAGWDLKNVAKAINDAKPVDRRSTTDENYRAYEDLARESNLGVSYTSGVKEIELVQIFSVEHDGAVSQFCIRKSDSLPLAEWRSRFPNVKSFITLFTVEVGNGNLQGSKGTGRILYNTSLNAEQARNLASDGFYLNGLLILKKKEMTSKKPLSVLHPVCVVDPAYDLEDNGFKVDVEQFLGLDRFMVSLAEAQLGTLMPGQSITGTNQTASYVNYMAAVEAQLRDEILSRFFNQFLQWVSSLQMRVCPVDNIELALASEDGKGLDAGVKLVWELLKDGLTADEIKGAAESSTAEGMVGSVEAMRQGLEALVAKYRGDVDVDQQMLKQMDIASMVGWDKAQEVLIPTPDETIVAEATRQQMLENQLILLGEEVPVSPRDNDVVHIKTLFAAVQKMMPELQGLAQIPPDAIAVIKSAITHVKTHAESAMSKGIEEKEISQEMDAIAQIEAMIGAVDVQAPALPQQANGQPLPEMESEQGVIAQVAAAPLDAALTKPLSRGEGV